MRYVVRKSLVWVVGKIWWPYGLLCTQELTLSSYDVSNATDDMGHVTRESLDRWLARNAGDFSEIVDFSASLEVGDETVEIPWATEEGELAYCEIFREYEEQD